MTNQDRLAKAVDRLERERALFLGRVECLSREQLDYRPSRQSWSIGQIAHHVALAEGVWHGYLKTVLKDGDPGKGATCRVSLQEVPFSSRIIPDWVLRSPFVLAPVTLMVNILPRPVQSMLFAVPLIKMDAGTRMQPKLGLPREQLLRLLGEIRQATLDLLKPVGGWDLARFRIIHPLVGDQDVYGILELLTSHEQRHAQQVDSIRQGPSFPAAGGSNESK